MHGGILRSPQLRRRSLVARPSRAASSHPWVPSTLYHGLRGNGAIILMLAGRPRHSLGPVTPSPGIVRWDPDGGLPDQQRVIPNLRPRTLAAVGTQGHPTALHLPRTLATNAGGMTSWPPWMWHSGLWQETGHRAGPGSRGTHPPLRAGTPPPGRPCRLDGRPRIRWRRCSGS